MPVDAYDVLCDLAQLDGIRICPLFKVFWNPEGWAVCSTTLEGDPVEIECVLPSIREAYNEAARRNQLAGLPLKGLKPVTFPEKVLHWLRLQEQKA